MLIILSQKIDTASEYADKVFKTYHYPARYRNQIHEGDTFVYYQGNRFVKEQRYYFGAGTIGSISTANGEDYYATLLNGRKFDKMVSIYHPDGEYVEQLGYDTIRKSPTPPWQSSVRPLSQQAFDYIISESGIQKASEILSIDELKEELKSDIRAFFLNNENDAIVRIRDIASDMINALNIPENSHIHQWPDEEPSNDGHETLQRFIEYCKTTHLTYSYKPVLILAFFECANDQGIMPLSEGIKWVKGYYRHRHDENLVVEKKRSVYMKADITDEEIEKNLIANPIKALTGSGFYFFNQDKRELVFLHEVWPSIGRIEKSVIKNICKQRLEQYYCD